MNYVVFVMCIIAITAISVSVTTAVGLCPETSPVACSTYSRCIRANTSRRMLPCEDMWICNMQCMNPLLSV